jgi:hypothetical protein
MTTFPADTPVHWAAPFALDGNGNVLVVPEGSPAEVSSAVFNIASCRIGFRVDAPNFGVDDLAFGTVPLDAQLLASQLQEQEPRATIAWREIDDGTPPTVPIASGTTITINAPGSATIALTVSVPTSTAF